MMSEEIGMAIFVTAAIAFIIGLYVASAVISTDASDGTIEFNDESFVRVDAEPEDKWCEAWVCDEYAEPYCFFETPMPCNICISGKTHVDENGNCPDGITKVTECFSKKLVQRRC